MLTEAEQVQSIQEAVTNTMSRPGTEAATYRKELVMAVARKKSNWIGLHYATHQYV